VHDSAKLRRAIHSSCVKCRTIRLVLLCDTGCQDWGHPSRDRAPGVAQMSETELIQPARALQGAFSVLLRACSAITFPQCTDQIDQVDFSARQSVPACALENLTIGTSAIVRTSLRDGVAGNRDSESLCRSWVVTSLGVRGAIRL